MCNVQPVRQQQRHLTVIAQADKPHLVARLLKDGVAAVAATLILAVKQRVPVWYW